MKVPTEQDWQYIDELWQYMCINDTLPDHADAIVIGGSGTMTDGAIRAAELYHVGVSTCVVVSGFNNPYLTSGDVSEAVLLKNTLVKQGVNQAHIIVDEDAKNTGDNILHAASLLSDRLDVIDNVILIHKPFMTRRFLATAEAQWPSCRFRRF